MTRLTRYVLGLMIGPFLFFVLVFTGVIWLSQSLRVIDTVVNNGQSAWVFLEFTALLLPRVMTIVLPVAAFAATLYVINRLFSDSEITVMSGAGVSGLALLRPVATFCSLLLLVALIISVWLVPAAQRELRDRVTEIRGDVAAAFIREGTFLSPTRGVSVYVRAIGRPGELIGTFIHDSRDPAQIATYTAEKAVLLRDEAGTRLVMFDGVAQIASREAPDELSVLRFEQFAYDLTQFTEDDPGARTRKPSELYLPELLTITQEEAGNRPIGEYRAEAHEALASPLYVLALPLLGVAVIVSAGFRRQGLLGRIAGAVAAGVLLRLLGLAAKSATASAATLWPAMYLPPLLGIAAAIWLLSPRAMAPRRPRGGRSAAPARGRAA